MNSSKTFVRTLHSSCIYHGKHNLRKFPTYGFQGSKKFREDLAKGEYPQFESIANRGMRPPYIIEDGKRKFVQEMIPELIVPDLEDCKMKPYVSYRAAEIDKPEFTSQDLFHAVYTEKIMSDFKSGKLNDDGTPLEPSEEEAMSAEEAKLKVQQTGSDYIWKNLEDPYQFVA